MKSVAEKILTARAQAGMTQDELAEKVQVSRRSIAAYERGETVPRKSTILKLGKVLNVSTEYLSNDECEDPLADISKDSYYSDALEKYGIQGMRDMHTILEEGKAFLAGGSVSQEQKDEFFDALAEVYYACKAEAKKKYGSRE